MTRQTLFFAGGDGAPLGAAPMGSSRRHLGERSEFASPRLETECPTGTAAGNTCSDRNGRRAGYCLVPVVGILGGSRRLAYADEVGEAGGSIDLADAMRWEGAAGKADDAAVTRICGTKKLPNELQK